MNRTRRRKALYLSSIATLAAAVGALSDALVQRAGAALAALEGHGSGDRARTG